MEDVVGEVAGGGEARVFPDELEDREGPQSAHGEGRKALRPAGPVVVHVTGEDHAQKGWRGLVT